MNFTNQKKIIIIINFFGLETRLRYIYIYIYFLLLLLLIFHPFFFSFFLSPKNCPGQTINAVMHMYIKTSQLVYFYVLLLYCSCSSNKENNYIIYYIRHALEKNFLFSYHLLFTVDLYPTISYGTPTVCLCRLPGRSIPSSSLECTG